MKILVTGSKGYIGQHLIKMLWSKHTISTLDINDDIFPTDITKLHVGSLDDVVKYDVVIHLAAKVRVNEIGRAHV